MKSILTKILLLSNIILISCQEKENSKTKQDITSESKSIRDNEKYMINIEEVKKHLKLQERVETDELEFENPYEYAEQDLALALKIIYQGLLNNGFKSISDNDFDIKMNKIFNYKRIYNDKCSHNWYYLNNNEFNYILYGLSYIAEEGETVRAADIKFGPYINTENYFFSKTQHFITIIPYLEDIIKINPDNSYKINLSQNIISRNKYLFNDDKSQFVWLTANDEYFMRNLVTTFGYTEDTKLLKWVIENTKFKDKDKKEFGELLWSKNCNGSISVHQNTFKVIDSFPKEQKKKYLEYLTDYISYLIPYEEKTEDLTTSQRAEIIAAIANYGENYRYQNKEDPYRFMGRIWMWDYKNIYKKEFEKNNYYNYPNFKERLQKAESYWEELIPENDGE